MIAFDDIVTFMTNVDTVFFFLRQILEPQNVVREIWQYMHRSLD